MRAGRGGVYGLSHRGRLRQLVRGSFRDLGPDHPYTRIIAVGEKTLWLVMQNGRLAAVSAATGRLRYAYKLNPETFKDLKLDARTDDLVFVHEGKYQRIRAKTGKLEEVRSPR